MSINALRRSLALGSAALLAAAGLSLAAAAPASAATATCNGESATIVGTDGRDDIEGTSGRDVIVGLAGDDEIDPLDRLQGTLQAEDDLGQFTLGSVDLDFGPEGWVLTAGPLQDYDQDQTTESLLDELTGLAGRQLTTLVRPGDGGDEAEVYVLNDLPYRDPAARHHGQPQPRPARLPPPPTSSAQQPQQRLARTRA